MWLLNIFQIRVSYHRLNLIIKIGLEFYIELVIGNFKVIERKFL